MRSRTLAEILHPKIRVLLQPFLHYNYPPEISWLEQMSIPHHIHREVLTHIRDQVFDVNLQIRHDPARVERICAHSLPAQSLGESNREQDIGRLCLAISSKVIILFTTAEAGIIKADAAAAMTRAGDVDDALIFSSEDERHDLVGEHEMAEMVRAELRLEPVLGRGVRTCHDGRIVDDYVDGGH